MAFKPLGCGEHRSSVTGGCPRLAGLDQAERRVTRRSNAPLLARRPGERRVEPLLEPDEIALRLQRSLVKTKSQT